MLMKASCFLLGTVALVLLVGFRRTETSRDPAPEYTADGQLKLPEQYREWVYLTSGFDMSYNPNAHEASRHIFDNVFVNREAYSGFRSTGAWPDRTVLVLENRRGEGKGSINQSGNYQGTELIGVEIHLKDRARFTGEWAFFAFGKSKLGKLIPHSADCYSCHAEHAAVDTTFVQFYPTLLPIAQSKATLSAAYLTDSRAGEK